MCGIAGLYRKTDRLSPTQMRLIAGRMAHSFHHRGPDAGGVMLSPDNRVAFAHRRLSIIDLSEGSAQPMQRGDGRRALCYNGELYNFLDIRKELEAKGVRFETDGDTEVVLESLANWGKTAFEHFDGMYALAYYDASEKKLILGRDNFGEKPLYYVDAPDYFAFASELSALTLLPGFTGRISSTAIAQYLSLQYVPAPDTIYEACRKLEPGCLLSIGDGSQIAISRHFRFTASEEHHTERSVMDLADELEELLKRSISQRMVSDVPLGAFLSGGVDSSTVVAIAQQIRGTPIETYSIGFEGYPDSEHFEAAETAKLLKTTHFDKELTTDTIDLGLHIASVLDEPNGDTSCLPTSLLCEFARKRVTVALSGDGGDELFGGYGRYFATADEAVRFSENPAELAWWSPSKAYYSSRLLVFDDPAVERLMGGMPRSYANQLAEWRNDIDSQSRPIINSMREIDASGYMPGAVLAKVDRMSMQHSLEVRAPLLSRDIAKFAASLAGSQCYDGTYGKLVLREVAERYLPKEWMRRKKRGFGLPMDMWGAEQLLPALRDLLLSDDCRLKNWISSKNLALFCDDMSKEFHAYRTWSVIILEVWLRAHPHEASSEPAALMKTPSEPLYRRVARRLRSA